MQDFQKETRASHGEAGGGEAGPGAWGCGAAPRAPRQRPARRAEDSGAAAARARSQVSAGPGSPGDPTLLASGGGSVLGVPWVVDASPRYASTSRGHPPCVSLSKLPLRRGPGPPRGPRGAAFSPLRPEPPAVPGVGALTPTLPLPAARGPRVRTPPPCRGRWPLGRTLAWGESCPECRRDWGLLPKAVQSLFLPETSAFCFPQLMSINLIPFFSFEVLILVSPDPFVPRPR